MNKKVIFALLGVFLMTSGIFVLISYVPTPSSSSGNGTAIPALSNVGETAGTSIGVNYWVQNSVANSGTTSFDLPYAENSSQNSVNLIYSSSDFTFGTSAAYTGSLAVGSFYYYQSSSIGAMNFALPVPDYTTGTVTKTTYQDVGTVYANISVSGNSQSWSHTFDSNNAIGSDNTWIEISPSWTLGSAYPLTFSISFSITTPYASSSGFAYMDAPPGQGA